MSDGDTPPRPGVVEYLKRDTITSIMFGLRIYTIIAGVMAILNPYRYFRSLLLFYNSLQPTLHQSFDALETYAKSSRRLRSVQCCIKSGQRSIEVTMYRVYGKWRFSFVLVEVQNGYEGEYELVLNNFGSLQKFERWETNFKYAFMVDNLPTKYVSNALTISCDSMFLGESKLQ